MMDDHSASRRVDVLAEEAPHLIAPSDVGTPHGEPVGIGSIRKFSLMDGGEEVGFITIAWREPSLPLDLQVIVGRVDEASVGNVRTTVI